MFRVVIQQSELDSVWSSHPTATVLQVWGEQVRQKMVLGSGKKLAVSPVWNQWQTTTPFSSPDTTRFLSTGDQCTAATGDCVYIKKNNNVVTFGWFIYLKHIFEVFF